MNPKAVALTVGWVLLVTLSMSASARADDIDLAPSKDNTLYEDNNGTLSNGAGDYFFAGITESKRLRRGLVAFDVAGAIPAGSTINSATLTLYMSRTTAGNEGVSIHYMLANWGEEASDATGEEGGEGQRPGRGCDLVSHLLRYGVLGHTRR